MIEICVRLYFVVNDISVILKQYLFIIKAKESTTITFLLNLWLESSEIYSYFW